MYTDYSNLSMALFFCLEDVMKVETNLPQQFNQKYTDERFWLKLRRFAKAAGQEVVEKSLWLYYAAQRPDVPGWAKTVMYSALGYLILPLDAIPDPTPIIGFGDDLGALMVAITTVASYVDEGVRERTRLKMRQWFGE